MIQRRLIYEASQEQFIDDVLNKRIADIMQDRFSEITGHATGPSEFRSWDRSTGEIKDLIQLSGLSNLHIAFEFKIPYSQRRIDCLLFGKNNSQIGYMVHIELKQWETVEPSDVDGNFVETYTGGGTRKVLHPSQQVEGYHDYLMGFVEIFEEENLYLYSCAYCHNYRKEPGKGLFDSRYSELIEKYPIFTRSDVSELAGRLKDLLSQGNGFEIFNRFMQSPVKPSKKLLEHVSKIVDNSSEFTLINDQIIARNSIMQKIANAEKTGEKSVIVVRGGPGTGKTVIALNILAELAGAKKKKSIFFSCKSKPLIESIKYIVGKNAKLLFTNLNPYVPSKVEENELDVLIIDEAHRIGKKSNSQFTPKEHRTDMPQIEQLVRCAKVSIFFIDDAQNIRKIEVGKSELIKEAANKYGCSIIEEQLLSQFRCGGSDDYLEWLESTLGHIDEKIILRRDDNFEFKIFDTPTELYQEILSKDSEKPNSTRMVAGFCWPWSKELGPDGDLVKDVKIGDFAMPWETHDQVRNPPDKYVKWYEWAYKPGGINQIGCIYTSQGFEFDYIGVIIGPDLKYDPINDRLTGNIEGTKDPMLKRGKENFDQYVKNIYRVLMSRGIKGCYVYFTDKEVEKYFKTRIQ